MPTLEPALVATWIAVATRCLGFFTSAPIIAKQIPVKLRVAFAFLLAFVATPSAAHDAVVPPTMLGLATLGAGEFLLGVSMGFMALLVYSAVHVAGTVMGFQIGTGVSQLFDPQLGTSSSEMARLITALVGLAVVVAGGHNLMVRGLLMSFQELPAGGQWLDPDLGLVASRLLAGMLVAGCEMAVPVVAVTMLSTIAIALSVRATPQLNVYFAFGMLMNLVLGLVVASFVLRSPVGGIDELLKMLFRAAMLPIRG